MGLSAEMESFRGQVEEVVSFLRDRLPVLPQTGIVLGTGLGELAALIEQAVVIPFCTIPHFPRATVESHQGNLVAGMFAGRPVAVLQGRFHYYEGYSARELTLPVRVLSLLGAETLVVTNAAGGLDPAYAPGTVMVIRDHLNFIPDNPLRGPNVDGWGVRFPDMSAVYDPGLIEKTHECARRLALGPVRSGIYAAVPGPSLETPAETRFLRRSGADAVGMSTVPEVIVARHAGMRVLALSVIANVNDPDNFKPILIDEVIRASRDAEPHLHRLIQEVLAAM